MKKIIITCSVIALILIAGAFIYLNFPQDTEMKSETLAQNRAGEDGTRISQTDLSDGVIKEIKRQVANDVNTKIDMYNDKYVTNQGLGGVLTDELVRQIQEQTIRTITNNIKKELKDFDKLSEEQINEINTLIAKSINSQSIKNDEAISEAIKREVSSQVSSAVENRLRNTSFGSGSAFTNTADRSDVDSIKSNVANLTSDNKDLENKVSSLSNSLDSLDKKVREIELSTNKANNTANTQTQSVSPVEFESFKRQLNDSVSAEIKKWVQENYSKNINITDEEREIIIKACTDGVRANVDELVGDAIRAGKVLTPTVMDNIREQVIAKINLDINNSVTKALNSNLSTFNYSVNLNKEKLNELGETLNQNVTSLNGDINAVNGRIDEMGNDKLDRSEFANEKNDMTARIEAEERKTTQMQETFSNNLDEAKNTLNATIETVRTELSGAIENLHSEITEISTDINNLRTELSGSIENLHTTISSEIETLKSTINNEISANIADINSKITDYTWTTEEKYGGSGSQSVLTFNLPIATAP